MPAKEKNAPQVLELAEGHRGTRLDCANFFIQLKSIPTLQNSKAELFGDTISQLGP